MLAADGNVVRPTTIAGTRLAASPRLASPHACLAVAPDWLKVFQPYILAPSQSLSLGVDALTNERNKVASRCAFVVVVLLLRLTRAGVD